MPVHFKGSSEYDTNYKWFDSYKSRSFSPEPEQMMDPAGKPSVTIYTSVEPPLQHKKRLGGPATSLSTDYFSVPAKRPDFTLLGQQEKFAENVRYQPKGSGSETKIYKNKENFGDASPPSKQLKMQKRIKPLTKERHPPLRASAQQSKSDLASPPPAPREVKNLQLKETLKDKDLRDVLADAPVVSKSVEEPRLSQAGDAATKQLDKDVPSKPKKLEQPPAAMNEFVQTNMKKGVAMSAPEAPANYALKYKAGIAQDRPLWKSSEYQKQFQWKKGMKASPLLAAHEIVHKSNAELGPYKTDGVPRLSEYNRQFQAWKPQIFASDVNLNLNNNDISNIKLKGNDTSASNKPKIKRSKSAAAALRQSAPMEEEEEDNVKKELKAKLAQTHGKIRRMGTEYRSNYKSPTRYGYDHGAWKGASAPQMMPRVEDANDRKEQDKNMNNNQNMNNNNVEEREDAPPLSNWFAEVIELRRRAAEYRKRAQGTHFSREHLVQLMARQNQCWDLASQDSGSGDGGVNSDNLLALDLHTRPPAGRPSSLRKEGPTGSCSHEATEGDSPVMSDVDEQEMGEDERVKEQDKKVRTKKTGKEEGKKPKKAKAGGRKSRKMAWLEKDREAVAEQARVLELKSKKQQADYNGDDVVDNDEDVEGRLPTPVLKQESPDRARRHHLDLTTPSIGGAILTCPAPKGSKLIITSRSGDSYVTASDDFPVQQQQKPYSLDNLLTMPTLGRPSGDTHPLRDEDSESDRPLQTQYVAVPAEAANDEDKENAGMRQQVRRSNRQAKPSKLTTVQEGFSQTWAQPGLEEIRNKRLAQEADDDALSVSVMSVASSASLASEVLERARKRQQFWTKDSKA
ncbi:nuclear protein MDM1 [Elysia marginata]|uniref:Nuclear protein MDM1 n=1 Tax=Elysia marginata TaxID=1093978 RepID=A0AAV4G3X4_9GAST|nr:nuclear protein MDM1 [Elysia marginata]